MENKREKQLERVGKIGKSLLLAIEEADNQERKYLNQMWYLYDKLWDYSFKEAIREDEENYVFKN